jgi:cytochrome c oxidase cbb3-type subunit III
MRALLLVAMVMVLAACEREQRTLVQPPRTAELVKAQQMNDLVSGERTPAGNPYERNAQGLADGKRLFDWFNCSGCHAQGGGDKGPALMDDKWLYGSEAENIVASILEGRPNGMPAFGKRVNEAQAWQLAAYVRSLAGLVPKDAATSRNDTMTGRPAENRTDPQRPIASTMPEK